MVLSGVFFTSSCSNDFDLTTGWKDIPVVYALLSRADTAHYVRVERAFLDPDANAFDLARIPDSLYYEDARVKLVRMSDGVEYSFERVDGDAEGLPREEGVFAESPNWLYKLKIAGTDTLRADEVYQLIVNRDETSESVTSTITTISDIELRRPLENTAMKFEYGGDVVKTTEIRWKYDNKNTFFFDAFLIFHYQEFIGGEWEDKSFAWKVASNEVADENAIFHSVKIPGEEFYLNVAGNIDGSVDLPRRFRFIEVKVIAGGESFYDYIKVNQANTGITGAQVIPNFTNMSEGFGLFASRHTVMQSHFLDFASRDSLKGGIYTKHLNFE